MCKALEAGIVWSSDNVTDHSLYLRGQKHHRMQDRKSLHRDWSHSPKCPLTTQRVGIDEERTFEYKIVKVNEVSTLSLQQGDLCEDFKNSKPHFLHM